MTFENYRNCFLELIGITHMNRRKVKEKIIHVFILIFKIDEEFSNSKGSGCCLSVLFLYMESPKDGKK